MEAVNDDGSFVDLSKAKVRYASSDPSVATVSRKGLVTAVGNGVATIRATVRRRHRLRGDPRPPHPGPRRRPIVKPGSTVTATTTYTNTGPTALPNASVTLAAPDGWTGHRRPHRPPSRSIPAGASVTTTWTVTPPADVKPGTYALAASATYQGATASDDAAGQSGRPLRLPQRHHQQHRHQRRRRLPAPATSTAAVRACPQQALAARGITSGGTVTHGGLTFTWPATGTGKPDNIVAGGQTVPFTGSGTKLGFLGTADYGNASGTGLITYTDGTSQTYTLSFADWWSTSPADGTDIARHDRLHQHNSGSGKVQQKVNVYGATVPLQAGKTVAYLTLPNVGSDAVSGQVAMHIFATVIG